MSTVLRQRKSLSLIGSALLCLGMLTVSDDSSAAEAETAVPVDPCREMRIEFQTFKADWLAGKIDPEETATKTGVQLAGEFISHTRASNLRYKAAGCPGNVRD